MTKGTPYRHLRSGMGAIVGMQTRNVGGLH